MSARGRWRTQRRSTRAAWRHQFEKRPSRTLGRSERTTSKGAAHEGSRIPGAIRPAGRGGRGSEDRAAHRRHRPDHVDLYLRLRSAHVRGAHRRRARARLRPREPGNRRGGRLRRPARQEGRPGEHALQHRLRLLLQLRARLHGLLPVGQSRLRRRRLRLREHGSLQRGPGRVPARAPRGLQLPRAPRRRHPRTRLRDALGHLPDGLPRRRARRRAPRRDGGRVRRGAGGDHGRLLVPDPGARRSST